MHVLEILAINFMRGGNCDLRQQCCFFVFLLSLLIRQCNFVFNKTRKSGKTVQNRY